jgi:hypothetical protein
MARRTRQEIEAIKLAMYAYCQKHHPLTVRQLFYALVCQGVIDKTEAEYKQTICRLSKEMRLAGDLEWSWLVDNTRWVRTPQTFGSMADCIESSARAYRRSLWQTVPEYVEVWLEKDALSGVFYDVTSEYDCPLMVTRGYPSLSYLRSAAETMVATGKPVTVYYFGDFDPSGEDISRNVEQRLSQFMDEVSRQFWDSSEPMSPLSPAPPLTFERVAVNEWQIDEWGLPTRPTKNSDSRAAKFGSRSVEVDAIPPDDLRGLVRERLARHISNAAILAAMRTSEMERRTLAAIAAKLRAA